LVQDTWLGRLQDQGVAQPERRGGQLVPTADQVGGNGRDAEIAEQLKGVSGIQRVVAAAGQVRAPPVQAAFVKCRRGVRGRGLRVAVQKVTEGHKSAA